MFEKSEIIATSAQLPIKIECITATAMPREFHEQTELLFVLNGEPIITVTDKSFNLKAEDLLLINCNDFHSINCSVPATLLSLSLSPQLFFAFKDERFNCNSSLNLNAADFFTIKKLLANLVKQSSDTTINNAYKNMSCIYAIIAELANKFKSLSSQLNTQFQKQIERLSRITDFINSNYKDNITLAALASQEHLSIPYLSAFIEKHLGMNFSAYYNTVRLNHTLTDLLSTDKSIETIAYDNGFSDPRSFVSLFKKKYNTLPSLYRKNHIMQSTNAKNNAANTDSNQNYLYTLAKYLDSGKTENSPHNGLSYANTILNIPTINTLVSDAGASNKYLSHNFKRMTSVGRARELLYSDVQNYLTDWQKKMNFEYIKFHGILSDDMMLYQENENGEPYYSFVYVDKVLDFLQSINLKPLIQLSFMPKALAKNKDKNIFAQEFNTSPPKSIEKWQQLIATFTNHLISRYTLKEVKTWLFCLWNEPDTPDNMFGFTNDKDFFSLYKATYFTIKNVSKGIIFGSPSMLVSYIHPKDWLQEFIQFASDNKCVPDFFNFHYYDNDFTMDNAADFKIAIPLHSRLNMDENAFKKTISQTKMYLSANNFNMPIYLTEWNLTVSHRNLLNDTCFKSCYLVKNLLENYDELESYAYWVLTDFIEETQPSNHIFHGGLGLFTHNGIKKPHYYALWLLTKLGKTFLTSGNGYFVTKSHGKIQIMLYNYEHFNHLFASGESFDMTFLERYTPFTQLGTLDVNIELINIPTTECVIKKYIINQKHGSPFDKWLEMGANKLDTEDIEYLKSSSVPLIFKQETKIENGKLNLFETLAPLEVRLIELSLS